MILATAFVVLTVIFIVLYNFNQNQQILSVSITLGTITYHIVMRLITGLIINHKMNNHANLDNKNYHITDKEFKFYKKLKVDKWKKFAPTFDSRAFSTKDNTCPEIAQCTCQAEIVHEVIFILSFLPIIEGVWFGDYAIFIITSILAALFDLIFVVIQRFNRYRIMKLIRLKLNNKEMQQR